ncbi:hypothetical protein C8E97_2713 [Saccharothrix australiensis]|uniref:Uncharacterized protein n=1 Tax=Saccharothrix australiensis TaxID=2072 RepID=A0A495VXH0_9PSEU|nr:hypothetical protein C8E97_2713 [Saccharothrix australiensis]
MTDPTRPHRDREASMSTDRTRPHHSPPEATRTPARRTATTTAHRLPPAVTVAFPLGLRVVAALEIAHQPVLTAVATAALMTTETVWLAVAIVWRETPQPAPTGSLLWWLRATLTGSYLVTALMPAPRSPGGRRGGRGGRRGAEHRPPTRRPLGTGTIRAGRLRPPGRHARTAAGERAGRHGYLAGRATAHTASRTATTSGSPARPPTLATSAAGSPSGSTTWSRRYRRPPRRGPAQRSPDGSTAPCTLRPPCTAHPPEGP